MSTTLTGRIVKLFQEQQISDKFKNRKVWIKTDDQYPQQYEIEFTQDKCGLLDSCNEGDEVEISINIRGRYWSKGDREGVMNQLQGWKIDVKSSGEVVSNTPATDNEPDDLPF